MKKYQYLSALQLLFVFLFFIGCNAPQSPPAKNITTTDSLLYAKNFSIERQGELTILTIGTAWKNAAQKFRYVLYPRQTDAPTDFPDATPIPIPIDRLICTGTTQVAMLDAIGVLDKLVALADDKYIYNPALQQKIADKKLPTIGNDGQIDYERGLAARPQVVFAFSIGDNNNSLKKWASAGVPVVMLAEFMEETPLGRAEWLRFLACFFGREVEQKALDYFKKTAQAYEAIVAENRHKDLRPSVFTGMAYEGTWYVAGGKSFMAKMIQDAGGNYIWADNNETGGLPLDMEAVYAKATQADVWLNVLQTKNKAELLAQNAYYGKFKAFQDSRIYAYNKRISANGGYDFFESAIVRPQLVLQDLSRIFSQASPPDSSLYYYQQLP